MGLEGHWDCISTVKGSRNMKDEEEVSDLESFLKYHPYIVRKAAILRQSGAGGFYVIYK